MKKFSFKAFEKITPYNYRNEIRLSIIDFLKDHGLTPTKIKKNQYDIDDLNHEIFISDSVTGNASGSYWCDSYKAKCCLWNNSDLLEEARSYFDCKISDSDETNDVYIRCYLCGSVLADIIADCESGNIKRF